MIQKSYENSEYGKLYLIPTPIGNLDDITLRAIKTLEMVDIVYAEDTRETLNLLKYLKINKKVESCHKYTEMKHKDKIVQILKLGKNIGYVTDRGTPLISDPGNVIVDESIKQNITVIALPGPNALLPAINMSGLSNERFLFYGFLNSKQSLAKKELIDLKDIKQTIIFYESPHRITDTLSQILDVFGNRNIAIVREISKIHEEVIRDNIENILKISDTLKGEMVIIVEGNKKEETLEVNYTEEIDKLLTQGYSKRDAIREIADKYNVSKNKLYNEFKEN
ncbi:ribosomal RNA small subunit methyltransferase I [Clostridium sp. CAG:524]|nr:ribosomal RNA small subunit methyltransferase I [Clostridium sp. CAG:524]